MDVLEKMIASEKIPHALLFTGAKGAEKATAFASTLIGPPPHPDIHEYFPEGKGNMHPIHTMRKLTEEVGFVPYQAKWKLFIIHEAEKMLPTSSNALLKTFEEPTAHTIILLLSKYPERMLPTVLSRCQKMDFAAPHTPLTHPILEVLARKQGLDTIAEEEEIETLLTCILLWHRDRLLMTVEGGIEHLAFPSYSEEVKKTPFIPLEQVEEALERVRLAQARSIKLSTSLESLFYTLQP